PRDEGDLRAEAPPFSRPVGTPVARLDGGRKLARTDGSPALLGSELPPQWNDPRRRRRDRLAPSPRRGGPPVRRLVAPAGAGDPGTARRAAPRSSRARDSADPDCTGAVRRDRR